MEENLRINDLFERYLAGTVSEQEELELMSYIVDPRYSESIRQLIGQSFENHAERSAIDADRLQSMMDRIFEQADQAQPARVITIPLWKKMSVAAAVLICCSAGGFLLLHKRSKPVAVELPPAEKNIAPGGNKAILTLANGSQVVLTGAGNGRIAVQGAATIDKTADGELVYAAGKGASGASGAAGAAGAYNMMSTPRGGQYHLVLSDGTKVWLNAASSIKYPAVFSGRERVVEITGEAYFEVAHNAHAPFRVMAAKQVVTDIGTAFNVNAYADEPSVKTTLISGAVEVSVPNGIRPVLLKPGQQAVSSQGADVLTTEAADTLSAVAWRDGYFRFDKADMRSIMRQFARWYNIDVEYRGEIGDHEFIGRISRSSSLQKVLKILAEEGVHYTIEGNKLIIL